MQLGRHNQNSRRAANWKVRGPPEPKEAAGGGDGLVEVGLDRSALAERRYGDIATGKVGIVVAAYVDLIEKVEPFAE